MTVLDFLMYKNQKILTPIVIAIFLIILVATATIGTAYVLKKNTVSSLPPPTSAATPKSSGATEWETYTNDKQKYSFEHPSEWIFQIIFSAPVTSKPGVIREEISNRNDNNRNWSVRIAVWDNPENLPLIDWLKTIHEPGGFIPKNIPSIPNAAAGKEGIAAVQSWIGGAAWDKPGKCIQSCPTLDFYFVRKDKAYRVELEGQDAAKKENQEIFRQVVSSFEFID
jgi:hypothetical protein